MKAVRRAKILVSARQDQPAPMLRALAQAGFTVSFATTGTEILTAAAQGVDAVVLDTNLPDVNGFEVCRRLRSHANTAFIPVVFLSSLYALAEGAMIASRLGAAAYLTKPVQPRDLVNVINLAICKRDLQSQRSVHAAQSA